MNQSNNQSINQAGTQAV